jgi:hypothetical protein
VPAVNFLILHGWENRRPGAQLDLPAGYGACPSVLDWCADPSVRITGR